MTCPFEQDVLLLDSEWAEQSRARLLEHVQACGHCGPLLKTLRGARASVQVLRPTQTPLGARQRTLARLKEGHARFVFPRWVAAVAVAVAVGVWWGAPPSPKEQYASGEVVAIGQARGRARSKVRLQRPEGAPPRLLEGTLELEIRPFEQFSIGTPHSMITAVRARFLLRVTPASTAVEVEAGRVLLRADGLERALSAGEWAKVPRPAKARLDQARALLATDPKQASQVARALLEDQPKGALGARALAIIADGHRRSGSLELAAGWYQRLAQHPQGEAYREEAVYQRALLLERLGRPRAALECLLQPVPTEALLPERLELERLLRRTIDAGL